MRFLMTLNGGGRDPDQQMYTEMGRFVEELTQAGVLLATGGLDTAGGTPRACCPTVTSDGSRSPISWLGLAHK